MGNWLVGVLLCAGLAGCKQPEATAPKTAPGVAAVDQQRIVNADSEPQNWLSHGRNYSEQRFSPLKAINADNVAGLKLAWFHDLDTARGQEATPLVIDGVMYSSSAWSKVQAFDAATGKLLWQYDPQVPREAGVKACCDVVNRGVAAWQGKLFVGTIDGRLIAIDARDGKEVWSVVTVDQSKPYTITGAPRVIGNRVLIGNGGAEYGVRGYVTAYDAASGTQIWRFYTVPGDPALAQESAALEKARATWNGRWWENGGGGTVWDAMAYDADLDLLYIGVGNGSPWNIEVRSPGGGDNLYLSSIVALHASSGEYAWHYQTTPAEQWDFTATQHMILADLTIAGRLRKVIMQAPKNGFFYVLDRTNGEFISARNYVPANWASGIDAGTGRPNVNPEAYYDRTGKMFFASPGPLGGHNWQPMSFSPLTGLVYIPAQEMVFPYIDARKQKRSGLGFNTGTDFTDIGLPPDPKVAAGIRAMFKGRLLAWDPVLQKERWRFELPGPWNGGVLSTAGNLVFAGSAAGFLDAFRADDGKKLWEFPAQTGVMAGPVSYSVDGRQYIAVVAGWGGSYGLSGGGLQPAQSNRSRVLAFALDGAASLPAIPVPAVADSTGEPRKLLAVKMSPAQLRNGQSLFQRHCMTCHGSDAIAGGVLPDLRHSVALGDTKAWRSIVHDGALVRGGMVSFGAELSVDDVEQVRAYVVSRALLH